MKISLRSIKKNLTCFLILIILSISFYFINACLLIKQSIIREPVKSNNCVQVLKSSRLFCMIITHNQNMQSLAQLMAKSWANKCDKFKFVLLLNATGLTEIDNVLQPPGLEIDDYEQLTDKVFTALKYIYSKYPDFDWYMKADDDTYVFVDNLRWFLDKKNASKPITFG